MVLSQPAMAGSRAEPTHHLTMLSKRGRGCLPATMLLVQPLRRVTPLWQRALGAHACRWPAAGTGSLMAALRGRLIPLCQAPDRGVSMSRVSGRPPSPFSCYSPLSSATDGAQAGAGCATVPDTRVAAGSQGQPAAPQCSFLEHLPGAAPLPALHPAPPR